mmetsp:Transcript_18854/g.56963  ORF Transcript_18854/g.56963 Transcript_18854/m.56963 type:complete len:354 (+) Transcript_18854:1788-2849(+)
MDAAASYSSYNSYSCSSSGSVTGSDALVWPSIGPFSIRLIPSAYVEVVGWGTSRLWFSTCFAASAASVPFARLWLACFLTSADDSSCAASPVGVSLCFTAASTTTSVSDAASAAAPLAASSAALPSAAVSTPSAVWVESGLSATSAAALAGVPSCSSSSGSVVVCLSPAAFFAAARELSADCSFKAVICTLPASSAVEAERLEGSALLVFPAAFKSEMRLATGCSALPCEDGAPWFLPRVSLAAVPETICGCFGSSIFVCAASSALDGTGSLAGSSAERAPETPLNSGTADCFGSVVALVLVFAGLLEAFWDDTSSAGSAESDTAGFLPRGRSICSTTSPSTGGFRCCSCCCF